MSDSRRDFLRRFAGVALASAATGCDTPAPIGPLSERGPVAVYGPPPDWRERKEAIGESEYVHEVYFASGRLDLGPKAKAALERQVDFLRRTSSRIVVQGHGDERGSREYNLSLGQRRAEAVRGYLTAAGIAPERIEVMSFGKERPRDLGHDEKAWAKNRRVDIVLGR